MEFKSGNTTIRIMDDFCSAPDQAERDAKIKKRLYANALAAIRANPERYYALMERREKNNGGKQGEKQADHGRQSLRVEGKHSFHPENRPED